MLENQEYEECSEIDETREYWDGEEVGEIQEDLGDWKDWARFVAITLEEVPLAMIENCGFNDDTKIRVPANDGAIELSFAECKKQGVRAMVFKQELKPEAEEFVFDSIDAMFFCYLSDKKEPYRSAFFLEYGALFFEKTPDSDYLLDYVAKEKERAIPYISKVFSAEIYKGYSLLRLRKYVPSESDFAAKAEDYLQILGFDFDEAAYNIPSCLITVSDNESNIVKKVAAYQKSNLFGRFGIPKYVKVADSFAKTR